MLEFEGLDTTHYAVGPDRFLVREIAGGVDADPVTVIVNGR